MYERDWLDGLPVQEVTPSDVEVFYQIAERWPAGVRLQLTEGEFKFSKMVQLPSNTSIEGRGADKTRLVLEPASHCHLFTNADHKAGNQNFHVSGVEVLGNGDTQERQPHHRALTFCCALYFKKCKSIHIEGATFYDIRQTAAHFNTSEGVVVKSCKMDKLGWSGISTSNASHMKIEDVDVKDAGRDHMHSAIHLDGGVGVYCDASVSETTGNGIMLDSAFHHLRHVVVKGSGTTCKRGVSLSGSAENDLAHVFISGDFSGNREIGIMVSNSHSVVIHGSDVKDNGEIGILMQGRNGGCGVLVADCDVSGNPEDISEIHQSKNNWVFSKYFQQDGQLKMNLKSLLQLSKK